jgi:hypothetical protein
MRALSTHARARCVHTKHIYPTERVMTRRKFSPNLEKIRGELWKRIAGQTDTQTHRHTHRNSPIYSKM